MKVFTINGKDYRLPNTLNKFQQDMYLHLINWKWRHITKEEGYYKYKGELIPYDAILPKCYRKEYPIIYPDLKKAFKIHHSKYPFRIHKFFNHMVSSQAANVNLFLPIIINPKADVIFQHLKSDFKKIARNQLDNGFRIEYWDEPYNNLNDHSKVSGTDADIAIAYYDKSDELCLWLIEHKLTENEFTTCGGFKSKGRKQQHDCKKSFSDILKNKDTCYCHNVRKYKNWDISDKYRSFFVNNNVYKECPFKKGMNQLWRNQLMALSVENDKRMPFKQVYFSVVKHPDNTYLDNTIDEYKKLINNNPKFSVFTSRDVVKNCKSVNDSDLDNWIEWYIDLYKV